VAFDDEEIDDTTNPDQTNIAQKPLESEEVEKL
jgi:hypothetical protein